jgi:hypothetical protein
MAKGVSLAEAMAAQTLGTFEGKDERRAGVEIPSVAGGLRKAMKIQPRRMSQGDRGYIAFEYVVEKIKHNPIDKENPAGDQERVHVLGVEGVTFIESDLVESEVEKQKERIAEAEAAKKKADLEAKGVHELGDAVPEAGTIKVGAKKAAPKKAAAARKARGRRGPKVVDDAGIGE